MSDLTLDPTNPIYGLLGSAPAPSQAINPPTATPVAQPTPDPSAGLTDEDKAWKARHSGVAGAARTVLGTLGDFLLSHLGMGDPYAKSQMQHKLNYAFDQGGQSADPQQQLNAIDNVQRVDFATGAKLRDQFIDNQRLAAQNAATAEQRAQRNAIAQDALNRKTMGTASAYLNTIGNLTNPDGSPNLEKQSAAYLKLLPQVRALARQNGLVDPNDNTKDGLQLPDTFDPDVVGAFINSGVPVGTQVKLGQGQERIDNQAKQAAQRSVDTERGQDMRAATASAGQGVTIRGQDIKAGTDAARTATIGRGQHAMTFTGNDGYRYAQMQDGRVIKSSRPVMPSKAASNAKAALAAKYGIKY